VPWDASYRLRLAQAELASNARDQGRADLLTVARDASAPYDLRVQAARLLAPLTAQAADLGSTELSFIAHPSTVATARQPYSAEARIAAAALASTSASDRELLLREAIAIHPGGPDADRALVDLFLLQPATAEPSATLAILGPRANAAPIDGPEPDEAGAAVRGAAIDSPDNVVVPPAWLPPGSGELDLATRIRLATKIATAHERDDSLESAFAYAELAVGLAKDSPQPELTRRRDDLKTAVLLARRNSLRRPDLHAALDQSNQVRPQLTASTVYQEESQ
jgi:hypothetical protein